MKSLILYGTTEGHTRKVAEHVADRLHVAGHGVALIDVQEGTEAIDLRTYDAAIVAGPIYDGCYPGAVASFAKARCSELNTMTTALLSVSLAAASRDAEDMADLAACVDRLANQTGWRPSEVHHAMGALKQAHSDFFRRWALKFLTHHLDLARGPRDTELTDWIVLSRWADSFAARASETKSHGGGDIAQPLELRQPHAVRRLKGDKPLRAERGKRPAHGLHR